MLSALPPLLELEQGLLTVCGTADRFTTDPSLPSSSSVLEHEADFFLFPAHKLAVFTEPAWHVPQDWLQCIAS